MEITEDDINRMKEYMGAIPDPRREWGNLRHKLVDMLVIALCTVIIGEDEFEAMEEWALEMEWWLRKFLELPNGIPDKDTFRRLFERLEPGAVLESLNAWLQPEPQTGGREVNIDGKTLRGSGNTDGRKALHVVSAWVGEQHLTLGQLATEEKSNEITAIPLLLDSITIKNDVVTIDAMGCQTDIAKKIREQGADYLLAVKENQPTLYRDIRDYFEYRDENSCPDRPDDRWESSLEKDHGRIERRSVTTVTGLSWLEGKEAWEDLRTLIRYRCSRTVREQTTVTDHYYISSTNASAEIYGGFIRGHWSIENGLHWMLDVAFREDASQVRKDNGPLNLNVLRKTALARLRRTEVVNRPRFSVRRKSFKALINPDFLYSVLFGK
jgi:predicted transposase YbfD/YdcC